jgi:hypothetical protein
VRWLLEFSTLISGIAHRLQLNGLLNNVYKNTFLLLICFEFQSKAEPALLLNKVMLLPQAGRGIKAMETISPFTIFRVYQFLTDPFPFEQ